MAYREAAPPPCAICEDHPAIGACECCRREVCKRHLPGNDPRGWCTRCDEGYFRYIRKSDTMSGYFKWWLGIIPAAVLPFVYAPLLALTIAYVVVGFPAAMWRGKRKRTQKFIAHARATGLMLKAPDDRDEVAQNLADYEYKRRNQQVVVAEPIEPTSD